MAILRVILERMVATIFGLVASITTIQAFAVLAAIGSFIVMPYKPRTPGWAVQPLVLAGLICLTLAAGGILMHMLPRRAGLRGVHGAVDETLPASWLLPAALPTLLFPAIALFQSEKLVQLWRDVLAIVDRFGGAEKLLAADGMGLLLLPAAAVLFVPCVEAAAGFFLIVVPPLLLALLWARSRRFRLEAQRLVVMQWSLVGASVLGALLFGRLVDMAAPHLVAAGPREGAEILRELTRGRQVLTGTAAAYAALVLTNALGLWTLTVASRAKEPMAAETPVPAAPENPEPIASLEPAPPQAPGSSPPEKFEDVLARYRARHPRGS